MKIESTVKYSVRYEYDNMEEKSLTAFTVKFLFLSHFFPDSSCTRNRCTEGGVGNQTGLVGDFLRFASF